MDLQEQVPSSLRAERSNPSRREESVDCFVAEFIIGPAEGGTRWLLAMTVEAEAIIPNPR